MADELKMPTEAEVLAAIDAVVAAQGKDALVLQSIPLAPFYALMDELFPKGHPANKRPVGMPHGLNQSPSWRFMERLGELEGVKVIRYRQGAFYGRKR